MEGSALERVCNLEGMNFLFNGNMETEIKIYSECEGDRENC